MSRRLLAMLCCLCVGVVPAFAGDRAGNNSGTNPDRDNANTTSATRDVDVNDVQGIPKRHRYLWAVGGGAALGAGIGVLLSQTTASAFKGVFIGGGAASAIYLARNRNEPAGWRNWALVGTNGLLLGGIGWTVCN